MRRIHRWPSALAVLALGTVGAGHGAPADAADAPAPVAVRVEVQEVDVTLPGAPGQIIATGIDDSGRIIGSDCATLELVYLGWICQGATAGYRWSPPATTELLDGGGRVLTAPRFLAETGQVAGTSPDPAPATAPEPAAWTADDGVTILQDRASGERADLVGMDRSGTVLLSGELGAPPTQRVQVWTSTGGFTTVADGAVAADISGDGTVVGTRSTPSGAHAFRWRSDTGVVDLGEGGGRLAACDGTALVTTPLSALVLLGADGSRTTVEDTGVPLDLTCSRQLTWRGNFAVGTNLLLPTDGVWRPDTGAFRLEGTGEVATRYGPVRPFIALDQNEGEEVVGGAASGGSLTEPHAVYWAADTGAVDLGTLGGVRSLATGINERGDIVGISDTADGRVRPFVARVVREPAPPTPSSSTTGLPATTVPVAPTSATSTPARPSSAAPRFTG